MTDPHDEYGEILRRALHAEADTVVPAADGLERIRARVSERPASRFGWTWNLTSGWTWFTASWARPAMAGAAAVVMAAVVVSAQPAISSFTVGGHGAPDQGKYGSNSTQGATQSDGGGQPAEPPPGPGKAQGAGPTTPRPRTPVGGAPMCGRPAAPGGPVAASTPDTPPPTEPPQTCTTPAEETTPTTPPPDNGGGGPTVEPPPPVSPPPAEPPPSGDEQPLQTQENP